MPPKKPRKRNEQYGARQSITPVQSYEQNRGTSSVSELDVQWKRVFSEAKTDANITAYAREQLKAIFGARNDDDDLRGAMPVDWNPSLIESGEEYFYAFKDDGERANLIIVRGILFLVLFTKNEINVSLVNSPELREATRSWRPLVLDGELLMMEPDYNGRVALIFVASSCLMRDGKATSSLGHATRHGYAQDACSRLTQFSDFIVKCKPIFRKADLLRQAFHANVRNGYLKWATVSGIDEVSAVDGLLSYKSRAKIRDRGSIFKVKAAVDATVDLRVRRQGRKNVYDLIAKANNDAECTVGNVVDPPEPLPDGEVCEFRRDILTGKWVFIKVRDKAPNHGKIIVDTVFSMFYSPNDFAEFFRIMSLHDSTWETDRLRNAVPDSVTPPLTVPGPAEMSFGEEEELSEGEEEFEEYEGSFSDTEETSEEQKSPTAVLSLSLPLQAPANMSTEAIKNMLETFNK